MFAVKRKVVDALLEDPEWTKKLEQCTTVREVEKVFMDFCKAKEFKINVLPQTS